VLPKKAATEYIRRQYPKARLLEVADDSSALAALTGNKADFYLADLLPTLDRLQRDAIKDVQVQRLVEFGSGHYHFAVRKDWAPLARILNRAIATTRDQPSSSWSAAVAALPASMVPARSRAIDPRHQAALIERPVWRLGGVRGLTLLNEVDASGNHVGIAAEYSEAVARQLGVGLKVVPFADVASMLDALRSGTIDVVPFLTRTEQRAREFGYSTPYVDMPYMIVARNDAPLYWDLGSLRGKRLALAPQHPIRELVTRKYPEIQVVDAASGTGAMDAVAAGRADAAVEVKFFANLRIQQDNDGVLRTVAAVEELPAQFHFATSRGALPLLPAIDDALGAIPSTEKDRMLRRWLAQDVTPEFPWRRYRPAITVGAAALLLLAGLTAWWMRRLRQEVSQRRRWQDLLHDVATTVPSVSFRYRLTRDGHLDDVYLSPNARSFFGFDIPTDRTLMESLAPYLGEQDRQTMARQELHSRSTGEAFKLTVHLRPPEGPARWMHTEAVRTVDAQGLALWTGYVVDVSTERELQHRLAREAEARHVLLASASHELRAPTHNIALALQSINHGRVDAETASALRIAEGAARTLTQLLNDVLDAARFDSGPMKLRPQSFDLHGLLEELAAAWAVVAQAKGLRFSHEIGADVPRTLLHDPLRLRQVLTNLLSNACKYTEQGSVRLEVARSDGELSFSVLDTGPGIAAENLERLFQPFVRLGEAAQPLPEVGSSGLGLSVCQRIAQAAGGRMSVRSQLGAGTQFSLHLPIREAAEQPVPSVPAPKPLEPPGDEPSPRLVVCDDDPVSRMLIAQMLRLRGYVVVEAADGEAALQALKETPAQALITDLNMPGMSGRELIDSLRIAEAGRAQRTVVIICSGDAPPPVDESKVPYDAYLLKPLQSGMLVRALAEHGVLTSRVRRA
jgi:two-component system sensor histidine kinase EvgS